MAGDEGSSSSDSPTGGIPATHPALARLAADGVDLSDVIGLRGIVGVPPGEGLVRLHPRLDDLTISVDVASSDILHLAAADQPDGLVVAWVWRGIEVTFRRTRIVHTSAEDVSRFFGPSDGSGVRRAGGAERQSGRLNIRMNRSMPEEMMAACSVCTSRCSTCMSRCLHGQHHHEVIVME